MFCFVPLTGSLLMLGGITRGVKSRAGAEMQRWAQA
jgi:hypothetical protein